MPLELQPPPTVARICAITAVSNEVLDQARADLAALFGPLGPDRVQYAFDQTAYYAGEMGEGLIKELVVFADLADPSVLPRLKQQAMELEKAMADEREGNWDRRANIDPGLVSIESLVLATTKYAGHRIGIAPGLYAETTLLFERGRYAPLPWTYRDYQREDVQGFLLAIRRRLLQHRRNNSFS